MVGRNLRQVGVPNRGLVSHPSAFHPHLEFRTEALPMSSESRAMCTVSIIMITKLLLRVARGHLGPLGRVSLRYSQSRAQAIAEVSLLRSANVVRCCLDGHNRPSLTTVWYRISARGAAVAHIELHGPVTHVRRAIDYNSFCWLKISQYLIIYLNCVLLVRRLRHFGILPVDET